jgi:hypothetical protein
MAEYITPTGPMSAAANNAKPGWIPIVQNVSGAVNESWKEPTYEFGLAPMQAGDPRINQGIWEAQQRAQRANQQIPQAESFYGGAVITSYAKGEPTQQQDYSKGQSVDPNFQKASPQKVPQFINAPTINSLQQTYTPTKAEQQKMFGIVPTRVNVVNEQGERIDTYKTPLFGPTGYDPYQEASNRKSEIFGLINSATGASWLGELNRKTEMVRTEIKAGKEPLSAARAGLIDIGKTNIPIASDLFYQIPKSIAKGDLAGYSRASISAGGGLALIGSGGIGEGSFRSIGKAELSRSGNLGIVDATIETSGKGFMGLRTRVFKSDVKMSFTIPKSETEVSFGVARVGTKEMYSTAPLINRGSIIKEGKLSESLQFNKATTIFKEGEGPSVAIVRGMDYPFLAKAGKPMPKTLFGNPRQFGGVTSNSKISDMYSMSVGKFISRGESPAKGEIVLFIKDTNVPKETTGFNTGQSLFTRMSKSDLGLANKQLEGVTKGIQASLTKSPVLKNPTIIGVSLGLSSLKSMYAPTSISKQRTSGVSSLSFSSQKTSQRNDILSALRTQSLFSQRTYQSQRTQPLLGTTTTLRTDTILRTQSITAQRTQRTITNPITITPFPIGFGFPGTPLFPLTGLGNRRRKQPYFKPFKFGYRPSVAGILMGATSRKVPKFVGEIRPVIIPRKRKSIKW